MLRCTHKLESNSYTQGSRNLHIEKLHLQRLQKCDIFLSSSPWTFLVKIFLTQSPKQVQVLTLLIRFSCLSNTASNQSFTGRGKNKIFIPLLQCVPRVSGLSQYYESPDTPGTHCSMNMSIDIGHRFLLQATIVMHS